MVLLGGAIFCTIYNVTKAEAEEARLLQQRTEQVESVKAYIQDCEDEELAREETNRQIKAEKAEAARLEAERLAREQAEREQAEREAEQARLNAEKQAKEQQAKQVQANIQNSTSNANTTAQSGKLTKEGGVNYYNGRRETWYSSKTLYHKNTSQWTVGSDGIYRDKDGYVVCACSDITQGSIVETSHGAGRVLDAGCAAGTTDIYVAW